jgi:hypothetical protein
VTDNRSKRQVLKLNKTMMAELEAEYRDARMEALHTIMALTYPQIAAAVRRFLLAGRPRDEVAAWRNHTALRCPVRAHAPWGRPHRRSSWLDDEVAAAALKHAKVGAAWLRAYRTAVADTMAVYQRAHARLLGRRAERPQRGRGGRCGGQRSGASTCAQ